MYVSISRVETGGRLWRVIINRILFSLVRISLFLQHATFSIPDDGKQIMMQAVMLLTIGLQTGWYNSIALCVPFSSQTTPHTSS